MQRAVILAPGGVIELEHLWLPGVDPGIAARREKRQELPVPPDTRKRGEPEAYPSDLKSLERTHILETLAAVNGVRKAAAERLGMSERTLRYKLAQYRLEAAGGKDPRGDDPSSNGPGKWHQVSGMGVAA